MDKSLMLTIFRIQIDFKKTWNLFQKKDRDFELQFVVQSAKPTASPEPDFEKTQNA